MDGGSEHRHWDDLIPDALGLIFSNVSLQDKLTVVPRVCKAWNRAVAGPFCWQEIDIEEWSKHCRPEQQDRMLRMLITRSYGSLRKLCVSSLHNDTIFSFIAEHAGSLHTLRLPRSDMSNSIVEQIAGKLSTITFLDLSYCSKISGAALLAIGEHCKLLVGLSRNMHPWDTAEKVTQDDEAYAIADRMPKLKHLEVAYLLMSTRAALEILSGCPDLEYVDLRGCWDVKLDHTFIKEKFPKLKMLGPRESGYHELMDDWDDDYSLASFDYTDSSDYLPWEFSAGDVGDLDDVNNSYDEMWDDEQRLEELELRYYEEIEDARLYDWPSSP
uniref:F-box protein FBW2 n=2 Tax=Rhizophora mucronata TaxID=61149 RepID=A0A2P2JVH2_RHIMU